MQWFKLYGIEMMSDPKYQRLTPAERSCWITLLCLASLDDGVVKHCEEDYLMTQSGISPLSDDWNKTRGILTKLEMLGMITQSRYHISIKNWQKRQQSNLTGYERVKKYRLKQRENNLMITNDNISDNANDNIDKNRIEENRIDKNRIESITPAQEARDFFNGNIEEILNHFKEQTKIEYSILKSEFQKFILYWTEKNKSGTKQRWEQQSTFEVKRRLATWLGRVQNFNGKRETKIL